MEPSQFFSLYIADSHRENVIHQLEVMSADSKRKKSKICDFVDYFFKAPKAFSWETSIERAEAQRFIKFSSFLKFVRPTDEKIEGAPFADNLFYPIFCTALAVGLFEQFNKERLSLYTFTELLGINSCFEKYIDFKKIDTTYFRNRLKGHWEACYPLISESSISFSHIVHDFTKEFFSQRPLRDNQTTLTMTLIGEYLSGADLHAFRQTCVYAYNLVERTSLLILKHRFFVISKNRALSRRFGHPLGFSNGYFATTYRNNSIVKLYSLKNPELTFQFIFDPIAYKIFEGICIIPHENSFTIFLPIKIGQNDTSVRLYRCHIDAEGNYIKKESITIHPPQSPNIFIAADSKVDIQLHNNQLLISRKCMEFTRRDLRTITMISKNETCGISIPLSDFYKGSFIFSKIKK